MLDEPRILDRHPVERLDDYVASGGGDGFRTALDAVPAPVRRHEQAGDRIAVADEQERVDGAVDHRVADRSGAGSEDHALHATDVTRQTLAGIGRAGRLGSTRPIGSQWQGR